MSNPAGRPISSDNYERYAWLMRFGIKVTHRRLWGMTDKLMAQLSYCRSDEARRLILGIGEKF